MMDGLAFGRGALLVMTSGCLFATLDAIAKTLTDSYSPFQGSWLRFALHACFVGLWFHFRGQHHYLRTRRLGLQSARAIALVLVSVSMYWAVSLMPLAKATVIQFLSPVFVTLWSVVFLGEHIGWARVIAVIAGFLGVAVVMGTDFSTFSFTMLLPLLTACSLAAFVLLTRLLSEADEALPALGLMPLICTLIVLPILPFVWGGIGRADVPVILTMALCGTAGHVFLQYGLRFAPASIMSPFLYVQVLWAATLSITFFADPIGLNFLLGALIIIISSGVAIWWRENRLI